MTNHPNRGKQQRRAMEGARASGLPLRGGDTTVIQAQRTYRPEGVSVAHIDVTDRTQPELWQWWIWAAGSDRYPDGLSLADKLPLHRALRDRTAILSASKRQGRIVLTAKLP